MGRACIALAQGNFARRLALPSLRIFPRPIGPRLGVFSESVRPRLARAAPLSLRNGLAGGVLALVLALWGYRLLLV